MRDDVAECFECGQDVPVTVAWPADGPDPITELRKLPGARPHIDIVEARLHALLPPVLEAGCPQCGVDDCDCEDWAARARMVSAIVDRFAEYGYREGVGLARLAVDALQDRTGTAAGGVAVVPDTEAVREALAWFRKYPEAFDDVEYGAADSEVRVHAATIVRAALARDAGYCKHCSGIEEIERLARMAMQMRDRMHDDDPIGDRDRAELAEDLERIRAALARDVPAPEPQADEPPFAVGDRVRVKSTGRTGVLREIDSRGRHLIFGDDESWITGVRADNLEPAPEPRGYRKGFDDGVKYARDIDRTIARMTVPAAPVDEAHRYAEGYDPHETGSLLVDIRAAWLAGHRAALAAAGAVRGSAQEAREHMRFQNAIEQRLREHGAGYETEPWFPDVIYGAAAAARAAAGAERVEEER